jgi:hypothetical protein
MIYLKHENLLFIKPFKVAGTSFEIALSKFAKDEDVISYLRVDEPVRRAYGFPGPQNHTWTICDLLRMRMVDKLRFIIRPSFRQKYRQHIPPKKIANRLGPDFDKAFKVSIVRNPFDFLVSLYFWQTKSKKFDSDEFERYVSDNPSNIVKNNIYYYFNRQSIIDHYIRFEEFERDIRALEDGFPSLGGLTETFSQIKTKTNTRPKSLELEDIYYDLPELVHTIQYFHKEIIDRFGYRVPNTKYD